MVEWAGFPVPARFLMRHNARARGLPFVAASWRVALAADHPPPGSGVASIQRSAVYFADAFAYVFVHGYLSVVNLTLLRGGEHTRHTRR